MTQAILFNDLVKRVAAILKPTITVSHIQIRRRVTQARRRREACTHDLAAFVTAARKNTIRKRRQASENLILASTTHDELEKQLEKQQRLRIECKQLGFDTIELNANLLEIPEETLLRYVRLIKNDGLKARPMFAVTFNKSDIPGNRAFGSYVVPEHRSRESVEDIDLLIRQ